MDPRLQPATDRKNPLSPLMAAKSASSRGDVPNMCPYGCEGRQLDEHGYCRHLVGFTNDGLTLEPMKVNVGSGRRQVMVEHTKVDGIDVYQPEKMQKGDKLVQITTSSRVYRDVDKK